MTSKRSSARQNAGAPITGIATGNLGTAANLDDTQVWRTEDPKTGEPEWLADHARAVAPPAPDQPAQPVAARPSTRSGRNLPALAGVAGLVLLVLIAGSGFLSQLDLGIRAAPPSAAATAGVTDAQPSPTAESKEAGKGPGHCHGHGKHCGDGANED
jgi:hypothetical protein